MKINHLKPEEVHRMEEIYNNYPGPYAIDETDLDKIFPGIHQTQTKEYGDWVQGNLPLNNLKLINKIIKHTKPKILLEIGTFEGRTTYNMFKNAPDKSLIITIDPINGGENHDGSDTRYFQKKNNIGSFYKNQDDSNRIIQIYEDSTSKICSEKVDLFLNGEEIDFAFIDGGHTYENVKKDFEELVLPRLRLGGIVVFDDYNRLYTVTGVVDYLTEKARTEGYTFYWYAPRESENTNEVIFINIPESK